MFSPSSPSRFYLMLVLIVASFSLVAKGQTISGTIVGTITDTQGGILPGVGVLATNAETALTYQGVTDTARGLYVIPEVPPGIYRVRAKYSGFQPQEHQAVRVNVNRVTEEDFTLKISATTTVMVVQSDAPMTDINSSTQGSNFNQKQIRELPILSRDINNLALLSPGVLSTRTFSFGNTLVPFSSNGSGSRYNNFIVDSVSNNEPIFGGAATQFSNPDIFSDYAFLDGAPKAEFGRDGGSTINVITKSGSSKLHGTAFYFGQDNQFNALTRAESAAYLSATPPYYEHKAGGTLGGPLDKKKDTFFFLSYQYDRSRTDLSNAFPVIATLPTTTGLASLRTGTPSTALGNMLAYPSVVSIPALLGNCFNAEPSAIKPFGIPSTTNPCFYTGGTGTVGTTPGYTGVPNPGGIQFGSYDVPQGNLYDLYDHQASARIDRRLNDANDLYGRFLIDNLNTPQGVLSPAAQVAYNDLGSLTDSRTVLRSRTQSAMLDERFEHGTSLNEVRFSFSRIAQGVGAFGLPSNLLNTLPSATVADQYGGFGAFGSNFPSAGNQFTLGQDTTSNSTHSNVYEAQENYSLSHNRHSFKMGADFVRTESNIINVPSDLGHFFFGSLGQAGGFANAACAAHTPNCIGGFIHEPSSGQTNALAVLQSFPDLITTGAGAITGQGRNELPLRETDVALFLQDDVRVRNNVTLNLGIRYERFGQPINSILRVNSTPGTIVPTSGGEFGPRLGLAWAPGSSRKTVLRAGYALMYNQMPLNIPLSIWQSSPISPTIATITSAGSTYLSQNYTLPQTQVYPNSPLTTAASSIGIGVSGCGGNAQLASGTVPLIDCSTQNTVSPNLTSPYIMNWTFGVQRELNHNMVLEVAYVGTRGTDVYARQDLNPNKPGWNTTCLASSIGPNCLNPRITTGHGDITAVTNAAMSRYNALQANLSTRTLNVKGSAFTFTASYTYSHMLDTASDIFGPGLRIVQSDNVLDALITNSNALASVEALTPFPEIYNNLANEKGNSSYDRRHRFVFDEIWELPTPTSSRAARYFLGGWNLNGIGTLQSGQPFSALNGIPTGACADGTGDGQISNDRPDIGNMSAPLNTVALLKDPTCRSTAMGYVDLNGNAVATPYSSAHFVQVPLGRTGTAGRNILTAPGIIDFDFAVYKQFHWGETKALEFRWEVYDVLNHPNVGNLLGNVFSSNAQPTPGFAFSPHSSLAGVTGATPENAVDATTTGGLYDFLSSGNMNTGSRTMQFGVHFTF